MPEELSEREHEVIKLVASGLTDRQIGDELFISVDTVRTHVKNINGKLGAKTRSQAAVIWTLQQQPTPYIKRCAWEGCRLPSLPGNDYCPLHKVRSLRRKREK